MYKGRLTGGAFLAASLIGIDLGHLGPVEENHGQEISKEKDHHERAGEAERCGGAGDLEIDPHAVGGNEKDDRGEGATAQAARQGILAEVIVWKIRAKTSGSRRSEARG